MDEKAQWFLRALLNGTPISRILAVYKYTREEIDQILIDEIKRLRTAIILHDIPVLGVND